MTTDNWINLIAAIIVGGGTLFLGIMAWRTIRQTRSIHEREQKQRLLNEIIEWAIDVIRISWGFGKAFKEAIRPATEREQQLFKYAHVAEVKESFMQFVGRNIYITAVVFPPFTKSLQEPIKVLEKDLVAYIEFLDDWQRELQFNIANNKSDKEENSEKADEHVRSIHKSANKVIEEAAKIKTKEIGREEENMSKEGKAAEGDEPSMKDIEEHLRRQDIQMKKGNYLTGAAFGSAIALVGVSFMVQMSFQLSPYVYIWFLIVIGLGFMFWCWWKQSKVK